MSKKKNQRKTKKNLNPLPGVKISPWKNDPQRSRDNKGSVKFKIK